MKKNFKLVLALVLAAMMIVGSFSVMAESVGALKVNGKLTVSGLDKGDKVTVYHILEWDEDSDKGWNWSDGVSNQATTSAQLLSSEDGANTITGAIASDLAAHIGTQYGATDTVENDTWTRENVEAGLYMIIVEPATPGTIYNPIFVSANYYGDTTPDPSDSANSIEISENQLSYKDNAMAKKSTIPLDKTAKGKDGNSIKGNDLANGAYTADAGEEIDFQVETFVPKFGTNYTNPVFTVTDNLTGLALTGDNVKVYAVDGETETEITDTTVFTLTGSAADSESYTVAFTKEYLWGTNTGTQKIPANGQKVRIKYTAKVTDKAEFIVNQEKNTVDVKFSTKPSDTTGAGLLRDQTNHFTFTIDGSLIGSNSTKGSSTDAIKVGKDAEGNYIVESHTYEWSQESHGPLQGAEFKLYKDEDCTQLYTNDAFNGTVVSDAEGRITIKGLDAGEYWLKETQAPAGYIKKQDAVKVTITADITEEQTVEEEVDDNGTKVQVTYKTNKLNGYTVTFGDGTKTVYEITNSGTTAAVSEANRISESSDDEELVNTKGVELPSTGGIGTTIFYVGGSLMVLAAAILLITKRRMGVED